MCCRVGVLAVLLALGPLAGCLRQPAVAGSAAPAAIELAAVRLVPHDTLPTGTIRGRLSTDDSSVPLGGATIELPDVGLSARVDTAGEFELRGVPAGRHRLRARRLGFEPTLGSIDVPVRGGSVLRVWVEVQKLCFDYCPPAPPRAFGRIEAVP